VINVGWLQASTDLIAIVIIIRTFSLLVCATLLQKRQPQVFIII